MKDTVNVYLEPGITEELLEWAQAHRTSRSTAARAAIKVGMRHKAELYNQLEEEWKEKNNAV